MKGKQMSEFTFGGEVIRKATDEQVFTACVYPISTERDLQGDFCDDPNELRAAAFDFLSGDAAVWLEHSRPLSREQARVVESYLAPDDLTISGRPVTKGSWLVSIAVPDAGVWKLIREGSIRGISLAGRAQRDSSGNLKGLAVREISLVSTPAQPASRILAMKSADNGWKPGELEAVLKTLGIIEDIIETELQTFRAKRKAMRGALADPELRAAVVKDISDDRLREIIDAYCSKVEANLRSTFGLKNSPKPPVTSFGHANAIKAGLNYEFDDPQRQESENSLDAAAEHRADDRGDAQKLANEENRAIYDRWLGKKK